MADNTKMLLEILLSIALVFSIAFNVKFYRDFCLYRSAYRRVSNLATQTTLLMGVLTLAPYLISYLQKRFSK